MKRQLWLAAMAVAVMATAACGSATPSVPSPASAAPPIATAPAPAPSSAPAAPPPSQLPTPIRSAWSLIAQHLPGDEGTAAQTILTDIAATAQSGGGGFDRVSLEFSPATPKVDASYVGQATADASGRPVVLPGGPYPAYLQIRLGGAVAHDDNPNVATPPASQRLGLSAAQAYAIIGDFEGVVTVVIGLSAKTGFGLINSPGATHSFVLVDVQH